MDFLDVTRTAPRPVKSKVDKVVLCLRASKRHIAPRSSVWMKFRFRSFRALLL